MSNIVIIGTQWGDEGKGKIVDHLAEFADIVVRFQGGNNAGHTMVISGEQFISHLVPSGILQGKKCYLGNGMVIDPAVLLGEMDELNKKGIDVSPEKLKISEKAHIIMPYHKMIDKGRELMKGNKKLGTTGRGIGPCYEDKATRRGIRFADLIDTDVFKEKVNAIIEEKIFYLKEFLKSDITDSAQIIKEYGHYAKRLEPHAANISIAMRKAMDSNKKILFEGAQGTHLDIDHGTYPFVTSSNTVAGNACNGAGVGPRDIDAVVGIVKAYTTRVGAGPFPSELFDEIGDRIQEKGAEFGATTGRRRRCGWLDTVLLRNAVRLNSPTGLVITKLDVLGGLESLNICTHYEYQGKQIDEVPASLKALSECKPVYETIPGWSEEISHIRKYDDLPQNTKDYLRRIEELTNVSIQIVSVGPGREETIVIENPFQ